MSSSDPSQQPGVEELPRPEQGLNPAEAGEVVGGAGGFPSPPSGGPRPGPAAGGFMDYTDD